MKLKATLLLAILLMTGLFVKAQIQSVTLGIDGLHCSACSYGTDKSLRTLDFIQSIHMDLNKHVAVITFKPGKQISLDALAKKVMDAGFSVRSMYVEFNFNNVAIKDNYMYDYQNMVFRFVGVKDQTLQNTVNLHVIGENYMPKAEYKKWKEEISAGTSSSLPPGVVKKEYYVTL